MVSAGEVPTANASGIRIPTEKKPFTIAIVGGGIGGVSLAIGLLKQGINVQVYESAPSFGEIGAGVIFGPNSMRALGLLDPLVLDGFKRCATYNTAPDRVNTWLSFRYGMDSRNGNGKKLGDLILHLEDEKQKDCWTGTHTRNGAHRAYFLDELVKLVPEGTARFKKTLVTIEELPPSEGGGVRLSFEDGTTATADAVIGCDGIKSRTRQILHGNKAEPSYAGEYGYRALVPAEAAREVIGEEVAHNGQLYCGYGGFIITYPVEKHNLINIVAVRRKPWTSEQWVEPSTREDLFEDFKGWDQRLLDLISRFEYRDKWAMFDVTHDEKYYRRRVALLGDSAHASTANLGAGAGMAIEDAYILSNLLGTIDDATRLEDVFRVYDAVRRERTQRTVRLSRKAGIANEFEDPDVLDDFDKNVKDIDERYRWVWDFDLAGSLKTAKKLLHGTA